MRKLMVVGQKPYKGEGVQETITACDKDVRSDATKNRDELACPPPVKVMAIADPGSATCTNVLYEGRYRSKSQCKRAPNERVEKEDDMTNPNAGKGVNFVADGNEFAV
jgi:hypothetical protein